MGNWAWGIGHGALGMGHWEYSQQSTVNSQQLTVNSQQLFLNLKTTDLEAYTAQFLGEQEAQIQQPENSATVAKLGFAIAPPEKTECPQEFSSKSRSPPLDPTMTLPSRSPNCKQSPNQILDRPKPAAKLAVLAVKSNRSKIVRFCKRLTNWRILAIQMLWRLL